VTSTEESVLIPFQYGRRYITVAELRYILTFNYHPEYVDRLCAWLVYMNGSVGVGGGFRADGTQPDQEGFAPEGKSFHQNQQYSDGYIGACAVDLVTPDGPDGNHVHDSIPWSLVPQQGTEFARIWGVHCNVGYPGKQGSESWHMQPTEIDGHDSWERAGSPAPVLGYPFPGRFALPPSSSKTGEYEMRLITPVRVLDERAGLGRRTDHSARVVPHGDNETVASCSVTIIPDGVAGYATDQEGTSFLSHGPTDNANVVLDLPIQADGTVVFFTRRAVHCIVDVRGLGVGIE